MKLTSTGLLLLVAQICVICHGGEKSLVNPANFDKDGEIGLSIDELRLYVIARDDLKPDVSAAFKEGKLIQDALNPDGSARRDYLEGLSKKSLDDQANNKVGEIISRLGDSKSRERPKPPFPIAAILDAEGLYIAADGNVKSKKTKKELQLSMPGVFGERKEVKNGFLGPFRLRKSADDWSVELNDADGAKIAYSDDRQSGKSTWSSEGALIYPLGFAKDNTRSDPDSSIRSERWRLLPSASWNVVSIGKTHEGDIEELQFKVPFVWSANHAGVGWLRNSEVAISPYFLTDFGFKGVVEGFSISYIPYVFDGISGFAVNTGYKGLGRLPLMYRVGLVPTLDYNHLSSTSRFISRDDHDNYFRIGARAEIGVRMEDYPSLELLTSYQPFAGYKRRS